MENILKMSESLKIKLDQLKRTRSCSCASVGNLSSPSHGAEETFQGTAHVVHTGEFTLEGKQYQFKKKKILKIPETHSIVLTSTVVHL